MRKTRLAIALVTSLGVAGCSGTSNLPVDDLAVCSAALLGAPSANPGVLLGIALQTPACQRLAAEALQALISRVSAQNAARGLPR